MNAPTILTLAALALPAGCALTTHETQPATLGAPSSSATMERLLDAPGPILVQRVKAADWVVNLGGLVNLDHRRAANLEDRDEAIEIAFFVLRHPERGTFLIDTGVQRGLHSDAGVVGPVLALGMNLDAMQVHVDLASALAQEAPLQGVFLTHLHLDHVLGLQDVPRGTPIYVGPGEADSATVLYGFVQSTVNAALKGHDPLRVWGFEADPDQRQVAVHDVFSDGSLFALHVPGHTPGSTAFVVRTPSGPQLILGDACHTAWGWQHGVEPGTFSVDLPTSATSLNALKALVGRHPALQAHPGHQPPPEAKPADPTAPPTS
jgi:N-acyl homoserine lactone hydrolase